MKNISALMRDDQILSFGKGVIHIIEEFGLGTLSKSDFEARLYSLIRRNVDKARIKDGRDWIRLLKVTPSKLRSMQLIESVKQRPIDLDDKHQWIELAQAVHTKRLEVNDPKVGTVQFYLDDTHLKRFIEEFVIEVGSSLDYKENRGQVVLKYSIYLDFIKKLMEVSGISENEMLSEIAADDDFKKLNKEFQDPKRLFNELKNKLKDKAIDQIAKETVHILGGVAFKIVKNKFLGHAGFPLVIPDSHS